MRQKAEADEVRWDFLVEGYAKTPEVTVSGLTCSARVPPWTRGAKTKDKVPLVEKMCLSLKPAS